MFSRRTPSARNSRAQAMAAAPAPLTTTRRRAISLPAIFAPLSSAAEVMMAVPCWSSCMTGMSSSSRSRASISKHSGALMSSRLMPPKVGAMARTARTKASGSVSATSMSKASMPAKVLNSIHFPSITGLAASGPILPSPSTAVPFDTTATRLPLPV